MGYPWWSPCHAREWFQTGNNSNKQFEMLNALTTNSTKDFSITILRWVQRLMNSEEQWQVQYVPREENLIADRLAKLGLAWKSSLQFMDTPLFEVMEVLPQDRFFHTILFVTKFNFLFWFNYMFLLKKYDFCKYNLITNSSKGFDQINLITIPTILELKILQIIVQKIICSIVSHFANYN